MEQAFSHLLENTYICLGMEHLQYEILPPLLDREFSHDSSRKLDYQQLIGVFYLQPYQYVLS